MQEKIEKSFHFLHLAKKWVKTKAITFIVVFRVMTSVPLH
jgi:hypothetical protein